MRTQPPQEKIEREPTAFGSFFLCQNVDRLSLSAMETIDFNGITIRKWEVGSSTFLAWPECGARLMNWHLNLADGSVRDVIHWPNDPDYSKPAKIRGGNPILFPFSARTFENGDIEFWKDPEGNRRPMQMHGYARDGKFELTNTSDKGFTATFVPCEASKQAYPYDYTFSVHYRFEELKLFVEFQLANHGKQSIPWSAGHHFYFALPWNENASRSDYVAKIQAGHAYRQDEKGQLVEVDTFETETQFDDPELSDRIHAQVKNSTVAFGPKDLDEDITIQIHEIDGKATEWNTFVTWTQNEDSPFYCVEPWMGPPNSPETRKGLHFVESGKTGVFSVEISLS